MLKEKRLTDHIIFLDDNMISGTLNDIVVKRKKELNKPRSIRNEQIPSASENQQLQASGI